MPAQCAELIRDSSIQEEEKVNLCTGSVSLGPAECLEKARSIYRLDTKGAVELCIGATSSSPAQCFEEMSSANREITTAMKIGVCKRAESVAPARCLMMEKDRRSYSREDERLSAGDAVALCRGATDSLPATCSIALEKHLSNRTLRVRLCRSARGAVLGASDVRARIIGSSEGKYLASPNVGTDILNSRHLPSNPHDCILGAFRGGHRYLRSEMRDFLGKEELLVKLCLNAISDAPVRCASSRSLHQLNTDQKVELCWGYEGKLGEGPAVCFEAASKTLSNSVSLENRVDLCRGMDTEAPAVRGCYFVIRNDWIS